MRVDEIHLSNYRGFKEQVIKFEPDINVFIGSNASGKTTILNAIIKSIYSLTSRYVRSRSADKLILDEFDINYNSTSTIIETTLNDFLDFPNEFKLTISRGTLNEEKQNLKNENVKVLNDLYKWFTEELQSNKISLPIVKFYPANRGSVTNINVDHSDIHKIAQLETWANIYQDNLSYSNFFHWFFEYETQELRLQRDNKNFNLENPKLKNVRNAIYRAFKRLDFGDYKIISKQIERKGTSKLIPTLVFSKKSGKQEEILSQLSDGQKAIVTLIADIAYNLSLSSYKDLNGNFYESRGIVLIDEIESHLHPKWQREIIPILIEVFPKIQFFIATHSPQVISSVDSKKVKICDDFEVHNVSLKTKGEDTNSLLKFVFESTERPLSYVAKIDKFNELIEQNADPESLNLLLEDIKTLYNQDESTSISNLINELNLRLTAYKFDREYEED